MAESWTISVGGRVYGPYNLEQMQGFHAENRLADHSMVARAGEEQFHPAIEDTALALLFQAVPAAADAEPAEPAPAEPAQPHRFGARAEAETPAGPPSHFVIVADMKSRSITGLEEEIFGLGQADESGPLQPRRHLSRRMEGGWCLAQEAEQVVGVRTVEFGRHGVSLIAASEGYGPGGRCVAGASWRPV